MLKPEHFLTTSYIAGRAGAVLRRLFKESAPRLPIQVDRVVEHLFDLVSSWEPITDAPGGLTLGGLRPRSRQLVLNDHAREHFLHYPGSENFTIGHEVGHWCLHISDVPAHSPLFPEALGPPQIVCTTAERKPPREIQADMFSSFLLMPEDLLQAECATRSLVNWPQLYDLARFLGVSITALSIRLQELSIVRIIDGEIERIR